MWPWHFNHPGILMHNTHYSLHWLGWNNLIQSNLCWQEGYSKQKKKKTHCVKYTFYSHGEEKSVVEWAKTRIRLGTISVRQGQEFKSLVGS